MMTLEQQDALLAEVENLRSELSSKDALLASKDAEIASLNSTVLWLRRKVFGPMTEKHLPLDPAQLLLFDQEAMTPEEKAALEAEVKAREETITKTITVKVRPARKPLDDSKLPVVEEHIYPEGTTDENGRLLDGYVEIGTEVNSRYELVPARMCIHRTIRHKVISKEDAAAKYPEERKILTPELPPQPVAKCAAGASVLSDIIVGKFFYHLPFYRIIQQYKELGITVSDSTMGGWYEAAVEKLKLLYDLLRRQILSSEYVQIDESVVPVIDNEKHKTRKGYEWCVRDGITGDVMFYYSGGSRGGKVAREILGDYHGMAQCDGYEAYEQFEGREGITLYGCWAHVRRKFVEALKENNTLATQAICYIRKLYKVESDGDESGLDANGRKELRLKESYPVIQVFEKWLEDTYPKVLPKSQMGKAIAYAYSLLPRLSRYVDDGRVNIDNNLIENTIRPLALGRKNYLFCGNDASAYRAAIVYSLIGTCKAAGVEPRLWMEDALRQIPYYLRDGRDLTGLLPRAWAARNNQLVNE